MKTKTLHSVTNFLESLAIAVIIILVSAIATAKAQNNVPKIPNSIGSGIFTPTAADRFFKAGREDFEREIDFLTNSENYLKGDLLQIDEQLIEQMKENNSTYDIHIQQDNSTELLE